MGDKYNRPAAPPPPLFLGKKERDLVKQVNDEVIERIIGQQVVYYPIDIGLSDFHSLYGESINKTFLPPIQIFALVSFEDNSTTTTSFGLDRRSTIEIHFHKRRLVEDKDLFVREGDFVKYGKTFYEISQLREPKEIFGRTEHRVEIIAGCIRAREGTFDVPKHAEF